MIRVGKITLCALRRLPAWALVLSLGVSARAEPRFAPAPGFGGFFRPGEWTPINVLIENRPDSPNAKPYTLEGTLQVVVEPAQGDKTIFARQVTVTHQQRLRVTLYAKIPESGEALIEFRTRRGQRRWWQNLKPDLTKLKDGQRLIVVASEQGDLFNPRSALGLLGPRRALVHPMFLPDRWIGYESVDLLVLPRDPTEALVDESQREALLSWLRLGGRVLAVGGLHYQSFQSSFLEPALPVAIKGSEEISFPGPDGKAVRLLSSTFDVKPGAAVLWSHGGRPLAARWPVGSGEATYVGTDLDSSVGRDVPQMRALWDAAVYEPGATRRHSTSESLVLSGVNFCFGRAARLPSFLLILGILACYTLLVGPINFYVLNRRRRLELAWLTIPAIVAAFSVLIYAIGLWTKGGLLIVREMDVMEAAVGAPEAHLDKLVSIFSPRKRSYNLAIASPQSALCSVWEWGYRDSAFSQFANPRAGRGGFPGISDRATGGAGWPVVVDQTRRTMKIPDRLMAQWSAQNFAGQGTCGLGGTFQGEAVFEGRQLKVRLENQTALPLRDAILLVSNRAGRVGDLAPGDRREFVAPLDARGSAEGFGQSGMGSLQSVLDRSLLAYLNANQLAPGQEDNDATVGQFLRAKVWQRFNEPAEGLPAPVATPLQPRLVGWLDPPPATLEIDAAPNRQAHVCMVVLDLPVRLGPGWFSVAAPECVSQLADLEIGEFGEFRRIPGGGCEMVEAEAVFVCSPGLRSGEFAVASVKPEVECRNTEEQTVAVSIFDFSTERWEVLTQDYKAEAAPSFPGLGPNYANPIDGAVFMRIAASRRGKDKYIKNPVQATRVQAAFEGHGL